jgi:hypothetical protein
LSRRSDTPVIRRHYYPDEKACLEALKLLLNSAARQRDDGEKVRREFRNDPKA